MEREIQGRKHTETGIRRKEMGGGRKEELKIRLGGKKKRGKRQEKARRLRKKKVTEHVGDKSKEPRRAKTTEKE
jgi:hypothetical protein